MYDQTVKLCASLPHFAHLFKAADQRGSALWQIIQWEDVPVQQVRPEQVRSVSESFSSRTDALRKSWYMVEPAQRNEKDHWGVLEWKENGKSRYQSVMPVLKYSAGSQNGGGSDVVRETSEAPASSMVRISEKANGILRRIADEDSKTLQAVLDDALQEYEKQRFFRNLNAAYQALRDDPKAWAQELQERAQSAGTLMDGLDTDEIWHEDGTVTILETERKSA